ncbi:MAG: uncharacterized protein H6R26_845 [Proteobacteria bacterium]|nr:uncharacterized protein [Pseudomonadota bacterium]
MKQIIALTLLLSALTFPAITPAEVVPVASARVQHVVIVWLKDHSQAAREQYIQATKTLSNLPMVLRYQVGTALPGGDRAVVDSSYDVAIVATFENATALDAYIKHPDHGKTLQEKLKPLVDKVIVYDFAEAQ